MMIQTNTNNNNDSATMAASTSDVGTSNNDTNDNDVVKINIGGKVFLQVMRSTLCQAPEDALFTRLFSKNPNSNTYHQSSPVIVHRDEEGRIFLDHDPELMETIVNFLRMKQIEDPFDPIVESPEVPPHKRKDFRRLLNHFGLTGFFFYPSHTHSIVHTTSTTNIVRSVRSMSIDEDHELPHHVLDVVSVVHNNKGGGDSSNDSVSLRSDHSITDMDVPGVVAPCPLGYDYCYG